MQGASKIRRRDHRTLSSLDRRFVWHPFTQMRDWERGDPVVITSGKGAWLKDARGQRYLDANSSIWTNLHGHRHPQIDRAIRVQLRKIAHSSFLGLANEPASLLAARLVDLAPPGLEKVFYSDDGSTAIEVALKMVYQSWRHRLRDVGKKPRKRMEFLGLQDGYHGDTVGAMAAGGSSLFHSAFSGMMFPSRKVMAPYCYRCPFNRARPERADAREYRKCRWECVGMFEKQLAPSGSPQRIAAAVIEPLVQGAAGMIVHPEGYLRRISRLLKSRGIPLILDEVMTAFGRTGTMFACEQERVTPDFLCLAKGLTGGYMPLAATLATQNIYRDFLGEYGERKTFFHGHSYSGNALGCTAALANLEVFEKEHTLRKVDLLSRRLELNLQEFWSLPWVGDLRVKGFVAGVELVRDWRTREPYPWEARIGVRVCEEAKRRGVLTRPIGNVIVIMPPFCVNERELAKICDVLFQSIRTVCEKS